MKQYRVTSSNFVPENSHIPDAVMNGEDLTRLQQLAGIAGANLLEEYTAGGHDPSQTTPNDRDEPSPSTVGSIASTVTGEKRRIEKDLNLKAGTPEWFRLWFARPELTGEKPVGDDAPDTERNPRYLLDKNGQGDTDKLSDLASRLDQQQQKNQAASSKPKY